MAEEKTTKPAAKAEPKDAEVKPETVAATSVVDKANEASADVLASAAESGDASVHQLLGERVVAEQNADEDELKRIDGALKDRLNL